jgi:hypothetical protein
VTGNSTTSTIQRTAIPSNSQPGAVAPSEATEHGKTGSDINVAVPGNLSTSTIQRTTTLSSPPQSAVEPMSSTVEAGTSEAHTMEDSSIRLVGRSAEGWEDTSNQTVSLNESARRVDPVQRAVKSNVTAPPLAQVVRDVALDEAGSSHQGRSLGDESTISVIDPSLAEDLPRVPRDTSADGAATGQLRTSILDDPPKPIFEPSLQRQQDTYNSTVPQLGEDQHKADAPRSVAPTTVSRLVNPQRLTTERQDASPMATTDVLAQHRFDTKGDAAAATFTQPAIRVDEQTAPVLESDDTSSDVSGHTASDDPAVAPAMPVQAVHRAMMNEETQRSPAFTPQVTRGEITPVDQAGTQSSSFLRTIQPTRLLSQMPTVLPQVQRHIPTKRQSWGLQRLPVLVDGQASMATSVGENTGASTQADSDIMRGRRSSMPGERAVYRQTSGSSTQSMAPVLELALAAPDVSGRVQRATSVSSETIAATPIAEQQAPVEADEPQLIDLALTPEDTAAERATAPKFDLHTLARQLLPLIKRMVAVDRERMP